MRMWNVNPAIMCNKHLLGEHVEMHMFIGCIKKNKSLRGYIENGLVELNNICYRHYRLVEEMRRRGMNHNTPMFKRDWNLVQAYISSCGFGIGEVNEKKNECDLMNRCSECRKLFDEGINGSTKVFTYEEFRDEK